MKNVNSIEKSRIIFIALIYNYLANNINSLNEEIVMDYVINIIKNLYKNNYDVTGSMKNNSALNLWGVSYDKDKGEYMLNSLKNIDLLYNMQPKELINASLQDSALILIGVNKKSLQIEREYYLKGGVKDIYSLRAKDAVEKTVDILESQGCKNIKIGGAIPDQLSGDKGYHVSYFCEEPFEKVNILKK